MAAEASTTPEQPLVWIDLEMTGLDPDRHVIVEIAVIVTRRNAETAQLADSVLARELPVGEHICLAVSDNGSGMDARTMKHIFDPFFSTKFAGRGLGMAAVLGIVHSHGGVVLVDSDPGQGSSFEILFPVKG